MRQTAYGLVVMIIFVVKLGGTV